MLRCLLKIAVPALWMLPCAAAQPELVLAGGALGICSSMSVRHCQAPVRANLAEGRTGSRYRVDDERIASATDPILWRESADFARPAMSVLLVAMKESFGNRSVEESDVRAYMESHCIESKVGGIERVRTCRRGDPVPWKLLLDDEQATVLSAIQEFDASGDGERRRERVNLTGSVDAAGVDILKAFRAAAAARADGRPRIAFVTASGVDNFDAVDFYQAALSGLDAEVSWWPIDAALHAAVFKGEGCADLEHTRRLHLKLPARDRVYPDLVQEYERFCSEPDALASLPDQVDGIFFAGGDQWRMRRAFFDAADQPNPALQTLRRAFQEGRLAIGGTSAGMAVQSAASMLSNGESAMALEGPALRMPPTAFGCTRAGRCERGVPEQALTVWPAGGLGLVPGMLFDTHFSERARELRLMRVLSDSGLGLAAGADEASALLIRLDEGAMQLSALGRSGVWLFQPIESADASDCLQARAHYLVPGRLFNWQDDKLMPAPEGTDDFDAQSNTGHATGRVGKSGSALDDGAMRAAVQGRRPGRTTSLSAGKSRQVMLSADSSSEHWRSPNGLIGRTNLAITLRSSRSDSCVR